MRVRDELNDEGLAAFRAGMADAGATPEQVEAALDADLPEGGGLAATQAFGGHGKVNGSHTHSHATYGRQGGDRSHEHMHKHEADANHSHHRPAKTAAAVAGAEHSFMVDALADADVAAMVDRVFVADGSGLGAALDQAAALVASGDRSSLVAAAMEVLGAPWGIEQRGDEAWELIGVDGDAGTFETYQAAVDQLGTLAFADGARPVLDQTWRSDMCFEDVETPDGRYIAPGGLRYRTPPLPLMLQTVTEIGHFGAVLCGTILSAKTTDGTALGAGEFDDNEAGMQALQIVEARGRFGVSIDGVSPAEAEYECTQRDEQTGECLHERVRFNVLTVGGLTLTPFPAFPDAYIAMEQRAAAASAAPDEPCDECDDEAKAARARAAGAAPVPVGKADPEPVGKAPVIPFTAAGVDLARPPLDWFADPEFAPGDGRMVRQPSGRWACPHTVTADGRVYGHMASWFSCHTGYADRCVKPPRSATSYQAFMLRPLMTAGGDLVKVGHLTMGCGHASTSSALTVEDVRAHYDGGPGAVRMAQVACGEDEFGIWYAGALDPSVTDAQVRAFSACSVSGDWRDVWGGGLELVACLAGVPVPGYPIAAAGLVAGEIMGVLEVAAREADGRVVALVAAGTVPQATPQDRAMSALADRVDAMEARLARAEAVTDELRGLAADRVAASLDVGPANGKAPEPAPAG